MISFVLLQNRQGKTRLSSWYSKRVVGEEGEDCWEPYTKREKTRIQREVNALVTSRTKKACNFVELGDNLIVYRRYAGLYFIVAIEKTQNPLIVLDLIHLYVEALDAYFGSVCELDLVYNFHRAYYILDEVVLGGHHQEPQRSVILASVAKQDDLEDEEAGSGDMLDAIFGD